MEFDTTTAPEPFNAAPIWLQGASVRVAAGFPSPAEDHQIERIELMSQLVKHPQATFFVRVRGDSMSGAGILPGSVVLVDIAASAPQRRIYIQAPANCALLLSWYKSECNYSSVSMINI
jgi:DNA polymerase V